MTILAEAAEESVKVVSGVTGVLSCLPWAIAGGAVLLGTAGGVGAYYAGKEVGAIAGKAACEKANADAVEKATEAARALSADLLNELKGQLAALQTSSNSIRSDIRNVQVTSGCGPALGVALDGLRRRRAGDAGKPSP